MKTNEIEINCAIAEIEQKFPANNLISSYKDFIKHRNYLHFYQYNEAVIINLIDLTHSLWNTKNRINRASLISVTKRYFKKAESKTNIPTATATKIFELFKEIVNHENLNYSRDSIELTKKAINSILVGIILKEEELKWLCDNSNHSGFILNRLLRYNLKSNAISNWAKENFEKDFARNRRSEITSWIINENPNFKIDKDTIEYDFEYQVNEDKRLVEVFKEEMDAYRFIEKEVRPLITSDDDSFFDDDGLEYKIKIQEKPSLNIPRRIYSYSLAMPIGYGGDIPDFKSTSERFYDNFEIHYQRIMAWSIAYSRLAIDEKINQLSKYYSKELYPTFFTIGKRLKSVEYFKWLKERLD